MIPCHSILLSTLAFALQDLPNEETRNRTGTESGPADTLLGLEQDRSTFELPDTVVSVTRVERTPFESPVGLDVITAEDLAERVPHQVSDALMYRPGIWVQKTGATGGAPILRGFMGNQVVYTIDGVRRNTVSLFAGPNGFLNNIDALDVDRIEVVRGPGSVLYGSDAVGGVVAVTTNERPRFAEQGFVWGGRGHARYSSADQEHSGRLEAYAANESAYGFFGVTRRTFDDLEGGRGVGVQDPSRSQEFSWDGQFDFALGEDAALELFAQDFSRPHGRRFDRPTWRAEDDRQLYGAKFDVFDLSFAEHARVTAYHQDQRSRIDERFFDSHSKDLTTGAEVQFTSRPNDELKLVYGAHFHHDDASSDDPQNGTADPDVTWDNPAVFALTEWNLTERLRLDVGLRLDRFTLKSDAPAFSKLPGEVQDAITNDSFSASALELDQTDQALTGAVGLVYELTDSVNLVTHVGRAFRAPGRSDLLDFGQFTFGFGVPTENLDPESSWTYELGLRVEEQDFAGAFTGFYTRVSDAIVRRPGTFGGSSFIDVDGDGFPDPDEQVYVPANSRDVVEAWGVEAEAHHRLPAEWSQRLVGDHALSWYGNFTWVYGRDRGFDEPLDRAFPANGLIGLRIDQSRDPSQSHWWAALETWMVHDFDRIPSTRLGDVAFHEDPQDRNSPLLRANGSVPGFTLLNLRGGVELNERTTLSLAVENLTDKKYRMKDSRIEGPGTNFVAALDVRF